MLKYDTINDDDRAALIDNEQLPVAHQDQDDAADNDNDDDMYAGGFIDELSEDNYNFMPATLPQPTYDDDFHNIELQSHVQVTDAPPDKWNFTYLVFYLLGIATMTPWNFFITAEDVSTHII